TELVNSGGTASGAVIEWAAVVASGGLTISSILTGDAEAVVYSGGTASSTQVVGIVAFLEILGGSAISTLVSGFEEVFSGGTAIRSIISGGGQFVGAGGFTSGTLVSDAAQEDVQAGGTAI